MSIYERLRKGSYRGAEFDVISIGRTRVKKNTEHQYANSVRRYIEERGVQNQDFTVTLSVFGSGEDYFEKRDALRTALEAEGEGVLVLPIEGEFNVKCTECSDSQNILETLGRCDFSATFKVCSENEKAGNPVAIKNGQISLANNVKGLRSRIASIVNNNVLITNALSYNNSFSKYTNFARRMAGLATGATSGAGLGSIISNFSDALSVLLGSPLLLGSAVNSIFNQFETVFDVASVLFSSSETLFAFGDTDKKSVSLNTPQKIEIDRNQQIENAQIDMSAVGIASNAFAQMEFDNEEDLQEKADIITAQLDRIEQSDFMKNSDIEGVSDIAYYLKQIRNDLSDVIAEKQADVPKIAEVRPREASVSMIAYRLYDSLDNTDGLIALNGILNPKSIEGTIKAYSNG